MAMPIMIMLMIHGSCSGSNGVISSGVMRDFHPHFSHALAAEMVNKAAIWSSASHSNTECDWVAKTPDANR